MCPPEKSSIHFLVLPLCCTGHALNYRCVCVMSLPREAHSILRVFGFYVGVLIVQAYPASKQSQQLKLRSLHNETKHTSSMWMVVQITLRSQAGIIHCLGYKTKSSVTSRKSTPRATFPGVGQCSIMVLLETCK